ncbi:chitinase [Immersiella caudata]|uniref:chitinase n=1 Tax=Immersiella caudata TaxID=314043 RepID=A0AA39WD90_9PEZI|nr:chitinase [Immersiella caudata]
MGTGIVWARGFVNSEGGIPIRAFATSPDADFDAVVADLDADEPDYLCSKAKPCKIGCCGPLDSTGKGNCGGGPDFCAKGKCTSQCDWKSECNPGWGKEWSELDGCPLNVCCSPFGFCGTTQDFCQGKKVASPNCPVAQKTSDKRTVGYYEGWNHERPCGTMTAQQIPLGYYTHINFAFAMVHPQTFRVAPMSDGVARLYKEMTGLKERQPGLEVWIAVGGWAHNDPGPYRTAFSDMAKSAANVNAFAESLVTFMQQNGFDGVDIDWEYPVADDRGGVKADFENYVRLLRRLRERLNATGRKYGISIAIPASYWYLRGFNLKDMEPWVDWFNIMTYDIHGTWDSTVKSIGSYAYAHTNLSEIDMGLELLWRNNVNPGRVNLGLGFYGRSFTMESPSCMNPGCPFKNATGAGAGRCTGTPGVLSAGEINEIIKKGGKQRFDEKDAVQIVTWDRDQWVSWDDAKTLKIKQDFANQRCLGGTMVWAIDLDDGTLINALGSNLGRKKFDVFNSSIPVCMMGNWDPQEKGKGFW